MNNLLVFQDQDATQNSMADMLHLEDYEAPNLPQDFFDACFPGDNELDFNSDFPPVPPSEDSIAPSQKPALMPNPVHATPPSDSWRATRDQLQIHNAVAGDTRKSTTGAKSPRAEDDISRVADDLLVDSTISAFSDDSYPQIVRQSDWDNVRVVRPNWQDVPNAQIEAVAGSIGHPVSTYASLSTSRVALPPTGSAICKTRGAGVRGSRRHRERTGLVDGCQNRTQRKGNAKKIAKQGSPVLTTVSEEERKRIRRVKNRASVEKCRNNKRILLEALQTEKEILTKENMLLSNATDRVRLSMSTVLSQVAALSGLHR